MDDSTTAVFAFDADFQEKIVALSLRDPLFALQTEGLIQPHYFSDESDAAAFMLSEKYWNTYRETPAPAIWAELLKDAVTGKLIKKDQVGGVISKLKTCGKADLTNRDFVVDKVDEFARNQAVELAIIKSVELAERRDFDGIAKVMGSALEVGATREDFDYDFFEGSDQRRNRRHAMVAGKIARTGVPSGVRQMDDALYHRGWGRKELTLIAGAAKSGKSMSLITFAANAVTMGYNVCLVSLEVSKEIMSDRLDANLARVPMRELENQMAVVHGKVDALYKSDGCGKLHLVDYPPGQLTPAELQRFLLKQESRGHVYDLLLVDYADIMRPNFVSTSPIENLRTIFIDLRAIAHRMNCALISPTQLNRDGFRAVVGKMEHVADDINKVRTADLVISINATDEEKARGEARFFFAASRNQEDGFTLRVKTSRETSNMVVKVLGVE